MSTPTQSALSALYAEAKSEIGVTNSKASLLLAFVGAVMAGAFTVAQDLPLDVPAYVTGGFGLLLLAVAAGLLLRAVRPNLGGGGGFPLWATLTPQQLLALAEERDLAAEVVALSQIAVAKFVCLRRAVDLTCMGGALLVLTLVTLLER
ncbi:Pycsar system effector family protein [Streptomyces sp. GbtcB6]|uniref:Pycsar system effector family protein n=1 Tax=Streptomyces sp. GbtcB6 TaxID=2824751 RepID=UPI001C2F8F4B|nr:Pycsar system effector family protein [Streptomyces sp. GbtcB6]